MRLRATIEQDGNNTGFVIPDEVVASLGSNRHPKVRVTINGFTYRSSVAIDGREVHARPERKSP